MFLRCATAAIAAASLLSVYTSVASAKGAKHAAMMLDANTGQVLHDEDGDELRHPASLTKMMTLYLTFEALESGRLAMSTRVPISQEAASVAPSKLDLEAGEDIAVGDAVKALITKSANDVAVALAEKIGGSERGFVSLMNQRARDLGMSKTNFENASGLPDADQVTTARDMITLGLRLQDDFPAYYPLFSSRSFAYGGKTLRNHNTLLNSFQGADGIKTGYTRMSGFNLVSSVRRGGRHVVGAVFGGASSATRNGEMRILLSKALAQASLVKTRKPAPPLIAKLKTPPKVAVRLALKSTIKSDDPVQIVQAPQPKPAVRPAPKPFAPPQTEIAAATLSEPVVATPPLQPAAVAVTEAAAAVDPTPVEVYKVKRVMVAPRAKPAAPIDPDKTTDMTMEDLIAAATAQAADNTAQTAFATAGAAPSPADVVAQRFATASVAKPEQETVIGKLISASAESETMSMLGAAQVASVAAAAPEPASAIAPTAASFAPQASPPEPARPELSPAQELADEEPPMLRGMAPSSLAAQAAALSGGRQRVAALASTSPAKKAGRFEIQIGAYASADEAKRALADVKTRAASLVGAAAAVTQPVQKSGRTMYRARFAGFDATAASTTCTDLRRQSIECFVMTAE